MHCKYILYTILVSAIAPQAIAGDYPSASELLDKYAVTQDKLRSSFIGKLEVSTKFEGMNRSRPAMKKGRVYEMNRKIELRSDGNRSYSYQKIWGRQATGNTSEEEAYEGINLWDDETYYNYGFSPLSRTNKNGTVILSYPKNPRYSWLWQRCTGGALRGYFPGGDERIDTELRQSTTISVQPQKEDINGSQCYVINARTKRCKFRIWIDPEHDYNIAKAIVKRGWACWNRPENRSKRPPDGNAETEIQNVRFKKIDDTWLPVECDYRREYEYVNGDYEKISSHFKITDFVMNPDHEALGSFKHDFIPNGARVRLAAVPSINYIWQDGELIPNIDESVIGEIDKMTEEIMAGGTRADQTAESAGTTVSELLKRYAETQDKLRSFVARAESNIAYTGVTKRTESETCEFRTDGEQVNHRSTFLDNLTTTKEKPGYKSFLWDGKSLTQYARGLGLSSGSVVVMTNVVSKKRVVASEYKGAPLLGICGGNYDRIDSILRNADNISLQPMTEKVGESNCYLIEATKKADGYKVWIDPQHGYNIAAIEMQRKDHTGATSLFTLKNVRFERIDDVWVPMEADMEQTEGSKATRWHHKRTQITLNPDHVALKSFVADDIPDGTKVIIPGEFGTEYIWRKGKPTKEARE